MARGLIFMIACIVVGGLFLLMASHLRKSLPPAGSSGIADADDDDDDDDDDGSGSAAPSAGAGVSRSELLEQDKEAEKAINAPNAVEAREWCKPERRSMGFEVSKNDMLKMAEELYALGARRVSVVGIEKIEDVEIAAAIVV